MRSVTGLISILITAAIGIGGYMYFLKQAAPGPGMVATQAISVTGVKNDLIAIAQAERMYFVQNGSYADLATLASSGTMNITRTSRDGYTYSVEPSGNGFTVTARLHRAAAGYARGRRAAAFPDLHRRSNDGSTSGRLIAGRMPGPCLRSALPVRDGNSPDRKVGGGHVHENNVSALALGARFFRSALA